MQQVVDAQSERLALFQAEKDITSLSHQDDSTGQGECVGGLYMYIMKFKATCNTVCVLQ